VTTFAELAWRLRDEGYTLLPDALPPTAVRELRDVLDVGAEPGNHRWLTDWPPAISELDILIRQILLDLFPGEPFSCVRLLLFDKTPDRNWPVLWHQDRTIHVNARHTLPGYGPWSEKEGGIHVHPPEDILQGMVTARVHLDLADEAHGGLCVLPGSHHLGRIDQEDVPAHLSQQEKRFAEAKAGDILFMKPLLLHSSARSKHPGHRRVIHMEYAARPLPAPLQWALDSAGTLM
jgi:hypothetical protein